MEEYKNLPVLPFTEQAAWEAWLAENHGRVAGLWLKLAKKASGIASVTYAEAVEAALMYGWIDSQKAGYDDLYWLQRFTPRRPRSNWSQNNRELAEKLLAADRMQPAGRREVEAAQADGRWEAAYAGQASMSVPEDLRQALSANPQAQVFFESLDSRNRYAILYQIETAKKAATRRRRIEKLVAKLAGGEKLYP